jgi:aspartyl-tRNA(Asn)/glutamyl-tRNA(Gln) amidotransferase subunit A
MTVRTEVPTELYNLEVAEAAAKIASGELSVMALNMAYIERTDLLEPHIKAYAYLDREGWLAEAASLDAEAKAGELRGPLHGIPVAIKDQFLVAGMPCKIAESWGDTSIPAEDATPVARLRAAGAIITGSTYMPDRFGNTPSCNPWNLAHTPGASSSGSSAAVGARMVAAALGESTGGSGIRPPAFCGVEALKPTYGRISRKGLYAISWSLDHPTIIGQTFQDIALVYNAVAGPDESDATSLPDPFSGVSTEMTDLRTPKIGFVRNFFLEKCDDLMTAAMEAAAEKLRAADAEVIPVMLPERWDLVWPAWKIVAAAERTAFHAKHTAALEADDVDVKPDVDTLIPATYYLQAQRLRRLLMDGALPLFDDVDFLYTPAALGPAPLGHGGGDNSMNSPWATVGMPTLTFNIGLTPDGLPLGAQLTATHLAEEPLLRAGEWCAQVMGRLGTPDVQIPEEATE